MHFTEVHNGNKSARITWNIAWENHKQFFFFLLPPTPPAAQNVTREKKQKKEVQRNVIKKAYCY